MSKNLLIYESDQASAENLSALFEQFGFSVFVADSETKVQEILDKTKINAFIVRAENPGMKGFMLCKKIRAISLYASRPILLISSDADEATFDRHREFDYHADYYLKLPADDET
ncbi:response regulator, partial [bacterium]|nr:response regulator [bacterium]